MVWEHSLLGLVGFPAAAQRMPPAAACVCEAAAQIVPLSLHKRKPAQVDRQAGADDPSI